MSGYMAHSAPSVSISKKSGNQMEEKSDGLYVGPYPYYGDIIVFGVGIPTSQMHKDKEYYVDTLNAIMYQRFGDQWVQKIDFTNQNHNQWHFEDTDPLMQGINGDVFMNYTTGDTFIKQGGVWTYVMNFRGPAGSGTKGDQGDMGPQGPIGSRWFYGSAVPDNALGSDLDMYLRTPVGQVYMKDAGVWTLLMIFVGEAGPQGLKGDKGDTGAPGADGTNGTNGTNGTDGSALLTGAGVPLDTLGKNGDFYIRSDGQNTAYEKVAGHWTSRFDLKGSAGTNGTNGTNGINGAAGADFPAKTIVDLTGSTALDGTYFTGNKYVKCNSASAMTLTIPSGILQVEPMQVLQYGAGQVTIVAGSGVTLCYAVGAKTRAQYSRLSVEPIGTNEFLVVGDTAA